MASVSIDALYERLGLPVVDEGSIDAVLGTAAHTLLFFTGDPALRGETADVAVVMPELLGAFAGRLRGAVVARAAEAALASRFRVAVEPSLVVTRGSDPVAVLPKIRDWASYLAEIETALDPAAPVVAEWAPPRTVFTHGDGAAAGGAA